LAACTVCVFDRLSAIAFSEFITFISGHSRVTNI
jgi:hypothetical protein